MIYVKIEDGVVVQKQPNMQEGFEEAPDNVICGMTKVGKGFVAPRRTPTVVSSREKRRKDLHKELSPEGTVEDSVGDMLDAIVDHIYGNPKKLDELKVKIDAIKARHP